MVLDCWLGLNNNTHLISFCDFISFYGLEGEKKTVDIVYLEFGKGFDIASHSVVLEKLACYAVDGCTLYSMEKIAEWPAQGVVGSGVKFS